MVSAMQSQTMLVVPVPGDMRLVNKNWGGGGESGHKSEKKNSEIDVEKPSNTDPYQAGFWLPKHGQIQNLQ